MTLPNGYAIIFQMWLSRVVSWLTHQIILKRFKGSYLVSDFASIQVHVKVLKKFKVILCEQRVSSKWTKNLLKQHFS